MKTGLDLGPMRAEDIPEVARLHHRFFSQESHGASLARLGPEALERLLYRPNLDNPSFFVDRARFDGRVIGFSSWLLDRERVFRWTIRHRAIPLAASLAWILLKKPSRVALILQNLRYIGGEAESFLEDVRGQWMVAAIDPEFTGSGLQERTGVPGKLSHMFIDRMEETMRARGCPNWYGATALDNPPIQRLLESVGARHIGTGQAQGMTFMYWLKTLGDAPGDG